MENERGLNGVLVGYIHYDGDGKFKGAILNIRHSSFTRQLPNDTQLTSNNVGLGISLLSQIYLLMLELPSLNTIPKEHRKLHICPPFCLRNR